MTDKLSGEKHLIYIYPKNAAKEPDALLASCGEAFLRRRSAEALAPLAADFFRVERPPRQKPFFPEAADIHFSVSHAGDYWACAFSRTPVGLDLERLRPCRPGIARRFFHPEEAAWLDAWPAEEFFSVWTAKESCVKYWGCGIDESFSHFSVIKEGRLAGVVDPPAAAGTRKGKSPFLPAARCIHIPFRQDYRLCLCVPAAAAEAYEVIFCALP